MYLSTRKCLLIFKTNILYKKIGKPTDIAPEYKQAYLPYDIPPTQAEIDRERHRFSNLKHGKDEFQKIFPVKNVPRNMFTYGKEGMTLPIAIFKDQPDPVIGPEWTYPGIYENKIACKHYFMEELIEMEEKNNFPSPWLRQTLENQVKGELFRAEGRMGLLKIKELRPMQKERSAATSKTGAKKGP